ncbi:DEAD/DEAH box helicase [Sporomusa aerivorans]|uniref:DEAD/DEAH box helicase n=1 Tax=Sporomusa aerivorans TaxID=204936 RepID=UPI003529DA11
MEEELQPATVVSIPICETWRYSDDYNTYIPLKEKSVSDAIGNAYQKWNPKTPVLISAQTGAGKNYFVKTILLPETVRQGKKILIISNRIALSYQTKADIVKNLKVKKIYSSEWLRDQEEFDDYVTIFTYQRFITKINDIDPKEYLYVVLDEAHFFMADATFNYKTGFILERIPKTFSASIRVYLTATPDEVGGYILESEKKAHRDKIHFLSYDLERDYSYVQPLYFKEVEEITKEIELDANSEDKWLIFVTNKEKGKILQDSLLKAKIDVVYLDSELKEEAMEEFYYKILDNDAFPNKVLISTSVLDNGVNFRDINLKNVVIFSYDKTTFLQMLGRKRIVKSGESVKLYIQNKTAGMLNGKQRILVKKQAAVSMFKKDKNKFLSEYYSSTIEDFKIIHGLFYFVNGNCYYNPLGLGKLENDIQLLSNLIDKIKKDASADIKEQLSWLGLAETFDEENWLECNGRQENLQKLSDFLIKMVERSYRDGAEQKELGIELKSLYDKVYGPRKNARSDFYGTKIITDILEEVKSPYKLEIKKENKTSVWNFIEKSKGC